MKPNVFMVRVVVVLELDMEWLNGGIANGEGTEKVPSDAVTR